MSEDAGSNRVIRDTLKQSADPRVARTRAGIAAAVHELSETGDELTVASVVRAAGISRASFYSHYSGLDELADSLRRDAFLTIADLFLSDHDHERPEAIRVSQERLVAHFADNRALYNAVGSIPVSKDSYLVGVRAMAGVIEIALDAHPDRPLDLHIEATARYVAGAAYGLLDAWISGELALTDAEVVEHLTRLLPPWFSGIR